MTRRRRSLVALSSLALFAAQLHAQCPDGTPPPCRGARTALALNTREWIVVPFGNVTRAPDLDWLREASVNLLTLEVGRWTDVEVVNDKRVGDLVRALPAARRAEALTLNDGLALARRAGAGNLVMGDFLRSGRTTRLVANVFDVRSGNRVRSVQQQAADPDSLLSAFGPLARGVLAVPPPPDARAGDLGTTSLDAYQAYLIGVRALNRFDLPEARTQLTRALAIDSTFALAHLQLAITLGWGEAGVQTGTESRAHALAAQRLGRSLPPRERALIAAEVAIASGDYERGCEAAAPLVRRDSNDVQALYMLGDCAYHDGTIDPGPSDTVPGTYRWTWNTSLRSLRRVLELDPSYHQAFQHILDIYRASDIGGCVRRASGTCEPWRAAVLRDGDSLVTRPVSMTANRAAWFRQVEQSARERPVPANLAEARAIAEQWVAADSMNERAQWGLANVLIAEGDVAGADAHLKRVSSQAHAGNFPVLRARMEVAIKLGRGAEARAWFDSLIKAIPDGPGVLVPRGSLEMAFGRLGRATQGLADAAQQAGPEAAGYAREIPRAVLGVPRPSLGQAEAAYAASMRDSATCRTDCRLARMAATLWYAPRAPRATWPEFGREPADYRFVLARSISQHDTAALRRVTWTHDSLARRNVGMGWSENNWTVIAAEGYLALGDSAAALRTARWFVDTALVKTPIVQGLGNNMFAPGLWPRMMLLRADLAAAAGQRDEARTWYDRVLDLWAGADDELRPELNRIRAAREAIGH